MINEKDVNMPLDADEINALDNSDRDNNEDNDDSDIITINLAECGAISALQQVSAQLSSVQRDYIRTISSNALKSFEDSIKLSFKPAFSETLGKLTKEASHIDLSNSLKPMMESYTEQIKALNTPLISDSVINAFKTIQFPTLAFSKLVTQTPMIQTITSAMVNMDYHSCFSIANTTLKKPQIVAPDIVFFKISELAKVMKPNLNYPRGLSTSLNKLTMLSALTIADNADVFYDVSEKGFFREGHEDKSAILPSELNTICSAKEILTDFEEEFVSEQELMDFMSILFDTPTFASAHPVGKKIYRFIKKLMDKDSEYKHGFDNDMFFHSRARGMTERPFVNDEMLRAPIGVTGPGRYNNPGRSYYYFADSANGSEQEIQKHNPGKIVQTVKLIPTKSIVLLDLSGTMRRGKTFLRYLRFPLSSVNDKTPREYLIPCYVAECCKRIGFEGIKYYGGKEYSNYVTWNDGYFRFAGNV